MNSITIPQGTIGRAIAATLGFTGVSFAGAAVVLKLKLEGAAVVERTAAFSDTETVGTADVEYENVADDLTPGTIRVQWKVTFADGKVEFFPAGKGVEAFDEIVVPKNLST